MANLCPIENPQNPCRNLWLVSFRPDFVLTIIRNRSKTTYSCDKNSAAISLTKRKRAQQRAKRWRKSTMHPLQQLMNQINQILAALLAIWLKLRNTRQAKGLTIEEAAELIGVAPGTYSRWERLRRKPHP